MKNNNELKEIVKDKYGQIARQSEKGQPSSCCGTSSSKAASSSSGCCGSSDTIDYSVFTDDYTKVQGYVPEADLNLGCGLPTEFAGIKEGDTVIDLGSGAGNDVFIARAIAGESGRVIGIDMTPDMIAKAEKNLKKLGYKNVEFRLGEIEALPVDDNSSDVIISNCVLNLVPDKEKAFSEIYRVLKPGGHFCISDIVLKGELPESIRNSAAMYAGCVSGALDQEEYLDIIKNAQFKNVEVKKSKSISLPDELLREFLSEKEIEEVRDKKMGIFSITVTAEK